MSIRTMYCLVGAFIVGLNTLIGIAPIIGIGSATTIAIAATAAVFTVAESNVSGKSE
ncbi:MAG: hypothetical protein WBB94_02365 [Candidatus Saccharimonadaceae bacterium]